jgi:chaperonin GroEL (HSP60 family)
MTDGGSGNPPVVILREETEVTSGTAVQEKLISAAQVFSDLLRPTYGPRGLDKMLYKTDGTTAVTNDGAKIVAELMVKHPAAKMFTSLAESQETACGDGVTGCLLLCGELLIEGQRMLSKGLHPLTIVDGYRSALAVALSSIESSVIGCGPKDLEILHSVAMTALTGKGAEGSREHLAELIVQAATSVYRIEDDKVRCDAEDVWMHTSGRGNLSNSHLISGVVMRHRILSDALPELVIDAKVATLSCDIKFRKQKRDAEIEIEEVSQLDAFIDAEEAQRDEIAKTLLATGATAIFSSGEVDRGILHRLMEQDIFVASEVDVKQLRNISVATSSQVVEVISDLSPADLGFAGRITTERRSESDKVEDIITIDECKSPKLVTLVVGGGNQTTSEEAVRALFDALRSTNTALLGEGVLTGGGAIYLTSSLAIRSASEMESGRERISMEAFARALEVIPISLATNAGADSLDRILEARAAHRNGQSDAGILPDGTVGVVGALEPAASVAHALEAACDTCCSMLRIDQVVSARGD